MHEPSEEQTLTDEIAMLRKRIAELEQMVAERDATIRQREDIFQRFLDHAPAVMFVKDIQGRHILTNQAFEAFFQAEKDHLLGKTDDDIFPPDIAKYARLHDRHVLTTGAVIEVEDHIPHGDEIRHYVTIKFPIYDTSGSIYAVGGIATDVTDHRRTDLALQENRARYQREREAVIIVAAALRKASSRADMIPILLEQVRQVLHTDHAVLMLHHSDTGEIVVEQESGLSLHIQGKRLEAGTGIAGQVITTAQPYLTNDVRNDPHALYAHLLDDINAIACVPLIAQEQVIGTLGVGSIAPISDQDVRLLNAIGDMAANALYRASLHEQTERRLQHLQTLHIIDRAITTSLDLHLILDILLAQVTKQLHIDAAAVLLFNPVTQNLEYAAGRGFRSSSIERTCIRMGEGYSGQVAHERRIVKIHTVPPNADGLRHALFQEERVVSYYGIPLIVRGHIKGVLELFQRTPLNPDKEWLNFVNILAGQAAIAIDHAELFAELQRTNDELLLAYDTTIEGLARALELRDAETQGHCRRVMQLTLQLARKMGFDEQELVHIRRGSLLHDVGKIAIPDAILLKPGPLTDVEYAVMQLHTTYAYDMLAPIRFLRPALDIPYCHHERWDGSGYPRGLKGEEIPLTARIFAVVDVFDALCANRPYRPGWPMEQVRAYLRDNAGVLFDPQVVGVFLNEVVIPYQD
jgi:PAS domain S-box-containing protein